MNIENNYKLESKESNIPPEIFHLLEKFPKLIDTILTTFSLLKKNPEVVDKIIIVSTFLKKNPETLNKVVTIFIALQQHPLLEELVHTEEYRIIQRSNLIQQHPLLYKNPEIILIVIVLFIELGIYPHILKQIVNDWKTPEIKIYMKDLIHPTDMKSRTGFTKKTLEILTLLQRIDGILYPNMGKGGMHDSKKIGIWD